MRKHGAHELQHYWYLYLKMKQFLTKTRIVLFYMCCLDCIQFWITPEDDLVLIYQMYLVLWARDVSKKLFENQFASYLNPIIHELGEGLVIHEIFL